LQCSLTFVEKRIAIGEIVNIGKPLREIVVEPKEMPVPAPLPAMPSPVEPVPA
jgi:hypothetical protein